MSDAYVIEISGHAVGIVARDHTGQKFRFFAATHFFNPLEGNEYSGPRQAEQAARRHFVANSGKRGTHLPSGGHRNEPLPRPLLQYPASHGAVRETGAVPNEPQLYAHA